MESKNNPRPLLSKTVSFTFKNEHSVAKLNLCEANRPIMNQKDLNESYSYKKLKSNNVLTSTINYCNKYYRPSNSCMKFYLKKRFPIVEWLFNYDFKENFSGDFIAGLTIGIVHIPQGMAYSLMAGLPPVYGLYVSLFPVLLYAILGSSRHLSIGSFAVTSIMTKSCLESYEGVFYPNMDLNLSKKMSNSLSNLSNSTNTTMSWLKPSQTSNSMYLSSDITQAKIMISMALTFMTGFIQICFAILHVGFLAKYLSDAIVAGFTTGAAFHIILSQINSLLGITTPKITIPFKIIGNLIEIVKNLNGINYPTLICSVISMISLILVKELINERFKQKIIMPVPIELIVVILGTFIAYYFNLNQKFNINIVGEISRGIPVPSLPPVNILLELSTKAFSIALVSYALNLSIAKLFSKKNNYEINPNQEALAYGISNMVTSLFRGFPSCVALSRSAILDSVGAKTQMFALISSALVLLVCLVIGPLFSTLPHACLAAVIVVALKNMIFQIAQLPDTFRKSKFEAIAWSITFLSVIILDVDIGLYIGVSLTLLFVIIRSQRPRMSVLGNIPNTEIYECVNVCDEVVEIPEIKILRFEESVYYANVDNLKYQVKKHSRLADFPLKKETSQHKEIYTQQEIEENDIWSRSNNQTRHVILDCSCINNIDSQGVDALKQLNENFNEAGIQMHLTYCKPSVLKMFKKFNFDAYFDYEQIYPSNHDAILYIIHRESYENSDEKSIDLEIESSKSSETVY